MSKARLLLVLAFVVVCAAGAVVGTAVDRLGRQTIPPAPPQDPLRLGLSPEQSAQMKKIWGAFDETRHRLFNQRRQYDRDRRAAFEALLSPDQLAQYNKIKSEFDAKQKDLEEQTRHAADLAVAESDKILTPEQRVKFHTIRDRMHGPPGLGAPPGVGGPHPHRDRGGEHHRPDSEPTTMPQTRPL